MDHTLSPDVSPITRIVITIPWVQLGVDILCSQPMRSPGIKDVRAIIVKSLIDFILWEYSLDRLAAVLYYNILRFEIIHSIFLCYILYF